MIEEKRRGPIRQIFGKRDEHGELSSSYFWFNLINLAITAAYILISYRVANSADPDLEGFALLTLVVSAVVTGNKIANKVLQYRYSYRDGDREEYNINVDRRTTTIDSGNIEIGKPSGKKVESRD